MRENRHTRHPSPSSAKMFRKQTEKSILIMKFFHTSCTLHGKALSFFLSLTRRSRAASCSQDKWLKSKFCSTGCGIFPWMQRGGGGKETSALCLYSKKYFSKKYYNDEFLSASALRLRLKREVRRILDIKWISLRGDNGWRIEEFAEGLCRVNCISEYLAELNQLLKELITNS